MLDIISAIRGINSIEIVAIAVLGALFVFWFVMRSQNIREHRESEFKEKLLKTLIDSGDNVAKQMKGIREECHEMRLHLETHVVETKTVLAYNKTDIDDLKGDVREVKLDVARIQEIIRS